MKEYLDIAFDHAKPISEPGFYRDVPMKVYHGFRDANGKLIELCNSPSVSSSPLRTLFHESAAHAWDASIYNPDAEEKKRTEAMLLGAATHHLLLGEAKFKESYAIRPETLNLKKWNGNRTDCIQWVAERELEGIEVLKPEMAERIVGMSKALAKHPFAHKALRGMIERTMVWRDPETGIFLKARPDNIINPHTDYADLKCVASVDDDAIQKMLADYEYPMQAAMVCEGARELLELDRDPTFTFLFIESTRPYCIRPVTVPQEEIDLAHTQVRESVMAFDHCMKSGEWPGPGGLRNDAEFVGRKPWAITDVQARLAELKMERMQ